MTQKTIAKNWKKILLFLILIAYLGRVAWINLQYRQKFSVTQIALYEEVFIPDLNLDLRISDTHFYDSIQELAEGHGSLDLPASFSQSMMAWLIPYWTNLEIPYRLYDVVLELHNPTAAEQQFNIMFLPLESSYFYQVAQIVFHDKIGDMEDWVVTLAPGETQTIHLIHQFRDEYRAHREYREVLTIPMALKYTSNHIQYQLIVQ